MNREWYELGLFVGFGALYILAVTYLILNLINMMFSLGGV